MPGLQMIHEPAHQARRSHQKSRAVTAGKGDDTVARHNGAGVEGTVVTERRTLPIQDLQ
jgi:hypothetical protein